jgi:hypothetical protein
MDRQLRRMRFVQRHQLVRAVRVATGRDDLPAIRQGLPNKFEADAAVGTGDEQGMSRCVGHGKVSPIVCGLRLILADVLASISAQRSAIGAANSFGWGLRCA